MKFSEILNDFRSRRNMTITDLAKFLGSGRRATEYWTSPTSNIEPRELTKQAVLTKLAEYDRKHKPKVKKEEASVGVVV